MKDRREDDDSVVRRFLKSEITWIIGILAVGWGIVTQVVLPINTMQITLVQIQAQLVTFQGYSTQITQNRNDIIRLIADDSKFKR